MAANVFSPLVPGAAVLKGNVAFGLGAGQLLRRLAALHQAFFMHEALPRFPAFFELLGQAPLGLRVHVHAAQMLREQILAVKLVALGPGAVRNTAVAAIELQAQVLRGDVTLPFILGSKSPFASGKGEGTEKGSLVCFCVMLGRIATIAELGEIAVSAQKVAFGR